VKFRVCYFCKGGDVDRQLAGFFSSLAPNTLESFTVSSMNDLGEESFAALSGHSASLKFLTLLSLERPAFESLSLLSDCTALEDLKFEANSITQRFEWRAQVPQVFDETVGWLKQCASLRSLQLTKVPNAMFLLGEVLSSPKVRLTSLSVKLQDSTGDFFTALADQEDLRMLFIENRAEDVYDQPSHNILVQSICSCQQIRELHLLNETMTTDDLDNITKSLALLEELTVDGEVGDEELMFLARLPRLKLLAVNYATSLSFPALLSFVQTLGDAEKLDPENADHQGLSITLASQLYGTGYVMDEEEAVLQKLVTSLFDGRIEIVFYRAEQDDLHESDFSD
jgi:hypothetical protein